MLIDVSNQMNIEYTDFINFIVLKMMSDIGTDDEVKLSEECKELILTYIWADSSKGVYPAYLSTVLLFKEFCKLLNIHNPDKHNVNEFFESFEDIGMWYI